jgi:hypothetical protein
VISFTTRPLYPRYSLGWRLGGPQNRSGWGGEEKNLASTGTQTLTPRPSSPYPIAIATALSLFFIYLFVIYLTVLWATQTIDPIASIGRMIVNNKWERMRKETLVV